MKSFLIILILLSFSLQVYPQNYIFKNSDGNYYSYANNYKYEFIGNKIFISNANESVEIEFKNIKGEDLIINRIQNSFKVNYYSADHKTEDLVVYPSLKISNITIQISDKLNIYNIGKNKISVISNQLEDNNILAFDKSVRLLVDKEYNPNLLFSSFVGSNGKGLMSSSSKDESGNVYFCGSTASNLQGWLKNSYDSTSNNDEDCFVIKLDNYNNIIWGTYVGGSGTDRAAGIDSRFGMVWVGGEAQGSEMPIFDRSVKNKLAGNFDAYIFRLNYEGKLEYGTYNGDVDYDAANDVKIGVDSIAWIGGRTFNSHGDFFTTSNAYIRTNNNNSSNSNGYNAFLMGFTPRNNCIYSSLYGNGSFETTESFCLTKNFIILGGYSESPSLENQIGSNTGANFLYGLDNNTYKVVWSYKYPQTKHTNVQNLFNFDSTRFVVTGYTDATNIAKGDVFQKAKISNGKDLDMFISIVNENGVVEKTTYFGGSGNEGRITYNFQGGGISIDNEKNIYVSGYTESPDLLTSEHAFQKNLGGKQDAFFAIFDKDLKELKYSTYLGGSADDVGKDILWANDKVYLNGYTSSLDFPITENAIDKSFEKNTNHPFMTIFGFPKSTPCENTNYEYNGFSNINGLVLSQDAVVYDSTLRLTKEDFFQRGAIWTENPIDLTNGLSSEFAFQLSNGDNKGLDDGFTPGADGLAFIIQADKTAVIGNYGGGIGYEGIKNALVIELDLYQNKDDDYNDPNGNHLAIFASKDIISANHKSNNLVYENTYVDNIQINKSVYVFKIKYDRNARTLDLFLNQANSYEKNVAHLNDFDLNKYIDLINGNSGYLGISAATGSSVQRHELKYWKFCGEESSTSAIEHSQQSELIYPNPAINFVQINDEYLNSNISIFDLFGNSCDFIKNGNKLNVSELRRGVYIIQFKQGQEIKTQKLIIEN